MIPSAFYFPEKGFEVLLGACALLRDRGVEFRCDVIGGPQELYAAYGLALRRLHARLGLDGIVRLLGARPFDEVRDAYLGADVFVLASVVAPVGTHDITPNVLIEAMATELAVVSTPVGGIPEIVDDGENGLLVTSGDASALADALERLLTDPALRRELGRAAREKVLARFDVRSNTQEYVRLFRPDERLGAQAALPHAVSSRAGVRRPQ